MKKYKPATFRQLRKELLKDKAFKKAYDDLELEFGLIKALIDSRLKKGMTQKQLAEKVGTKQSSIARFESGHYNPSLAFIQKLASAVDAKIKVT